MLAWLKSFRDWLVELGADVLLEGALEILFRVLGEMLKALVEALFS
ncbi:MAG: hypothetical protein H7Z21_16835 [Hymenobacter sp.]|nr:hypothetical protein [Hymenobacter sp.]